MIRRRLAWRIALGVVRVGMLLWIWSMFSRIRSISRIEMVVGLVVMTVGWQVTSMWADRVVSEWWERRKRSSPGRVSLGEIRNVKCEVCDSEEFLEGPHGGLCTNIKCVVCSAEYNYGPGIMERIHRN
jgi:hypothetical protein